MMMRFDSLRVTEIQSEFWEEFSRPKIIYTDIAQRLSFSYSENGEYLNNSAYFFSCTDSAKLQYLLRVLNSDIIDWYYRTISVQLGEKAVRMFSIYVLKLSIPLKIRELNSENDIYELFSLSIDEIGFIQDRYN